MPPRVCGASPTGAGDLTVPANPAEPVCLGARPHFPHACTRGPQPRTLGASFLCPGSLVCKMGRWGGAGAP